MLTGETYVKHIQESATCQTEECHRAANVILKNLNTSADPCENFYEYACGNYVKSAVIPDYSGTVNVPHNIASSLEKQLWRLLQEPHNKHDSRTFVLMKKLYSSCFNTDINNKYSEAILRKYLAEFGSWPVLQGKLWNKNNFNWQKTTVALHSSGFRSDQLLRVYAYLDPMNSTRTLPFVSQASLGLGREYLSRGLSDPLVRAYRAYMIDVAIILGANASTASRQLTKTLNFEMKLANISLPRERLRNMMPILKHLSIKEMQSQYPSVHWSWFIGSLLYNHNISKNEMVVLQAPEYLQDLFKLLRNTPKRVQANYMMWRVVESAVGLLSDRLRRRQLNYARIASGARAAPARWRECVATVNAALPLATGSLYVWHYFSKESRTEAELIVRSIRKQLDKTLRSAKWMDAKTKSRALQKLKAMRSYVGYPDELLNNTLLNHYYINLDLPSDAVYIQNALIISRFERQRERDSLLRPVNKFDWTEHGNAAVVNAFYTFAENSINVPAGILQGAFFAVHRPKYLNFGAIGTVIGHEMIHGYDDRGRQYDTEGNLADWWQPATDRNFLKKSLCFVKQYGDYVDPQVGLNLNGVNTQGENIADNGGAKAAYLAYAQWVADTGIEEATLPGLERLDARQLFWVSLAGAFCARSRPEYTRLAIITDEHSPAMFRVLGTLRNLPQFARDFNCATSTSMNPARKCTLW